MNDAVKAVEKMVKNARECPNCARVWRTYFAVPCPKGGVDCWECDMFAVIGDPDHPPGTHWDATEDVDEVVSYQCPHGAEYDWLCKGCGTKVSGWGMGAAGFGDLCGCKDGNPQWPFAEKQP